MTDESKLLQLLEDAHASIGSSEKTGISFLLTGKKTSSNSSAVTIRVDTKVWEHYNSILQPFHKRDEDSKGFIDFYFSINDIQKVIFGCQSGICTLRRTLGDVALRALEVLSESEYIKVMHKSKTIHITSMDSWADCCLYRVMYGLSILGYNITSVNTPVSLSSYGKDSLNGLSIMADIASSAIASVKVQKTNLPSSCKGFTPAQKWCKILTYKAAQKIQMEKYLCKTFKKEGNVSRRDLIASFKSVIGDSVTTASIAGFYYDLIDILISNAKDLKTILSKTCFKTGDQMVFKAMPKYSVTVITEGKGKGGKKGKDTKVKTVSVTNPASIRYLFKDERDALSMIKKSNFLANEVKKFDELSLSHRNYSDFQKTITESLKATSELYYAVRKEAKRRQMDIKVDGKSVSDKYFLCNREKAGQDIRKISLANTLTQDIPKATEVFDIVIVASTSN